MSEKANRELLSYLRSEGHETILVSEMGNVSEPVSCHPDIYYCILGGGIYEGDPSFLSPKYPGDVLYNAAEVGKYFICSKYTCEGLREKASALGLTPVTVPQGYVKCNLAVLDESHVITEDKGIAKALSKLPDVQCLLIKPRQVMLPGFDYGFIGGACGRVGDKMIFNGDLKAHSNYDEIDAFCRECGLDPTYFDTYPLTDIGSILAVN
ncbi:MAG: hypothetical protein J5528_00905 [Firmicutes bacterium]|nr:hypothetical protein [Bacillota bacterium]